MNEDLTCSGNEKVRPSLTTTLVFPNRSSRDFRRIEGYYFNYPLRLRRFYLSSFTPGYTHPESFLSGFAHPGLFTFYPLGVISKQRFHSN